MKATDCKSFIKCSAPICPLDQESLKNCIWYSDEDICNRSPSPLWIKQQKKIVKKCKNPDSYFTFEMLNRNFIVGKGIEGLDPDKEESPQLRKWSKAHRERRELTQLEKEEKRKLFEINVLGKNKSKEIVKIGVEV